MSTGSDISSPAPLTADALEALGARARSEILLAPSLADIERLRQSLLGKKGDVTLLLKSLGSASAEERKSLGAALNAIKSEIDGLLSRRSEQLRINELLERERTEWVDVTLPVSANPVLPEPGSLHALSHVTRNLERIFIGLGFDIVDGPELEREYFNFDALNVPDTHPARDMQDTIWTKDAGLLLRTHTSSIQARMLKKLTPPFRIVAPGRCFRFERVDATHEHTFHQMEGMMIDRHVSVGHLIYFMRTLLREIFGSEQQIRLRPGYFPFVEPGFELDIWFQGRWLELLPCGLVHPRVLELGGIDPNEWQGFAFGLGLSRLVMSRYEISDIRHLLGGDLRFLKQFR